MTAVESVPDLLADRLPLLVVDDDESVLQVTRLVLSRYQFEGKGLEILEASSAAQARAILEQRTDVAAVLLDVVMESDDAGLKLVETIRDELSNHAIRILLRTGQPGYAPQHEVIQNYDINDYLSKAEATQGRLFFSLTTAFRGYRDILAAEYLGRRLTEADKASFAKTQFLAHMSHEIRTPLNGLLGTVQLLGDTDLNREQQNLLNDLNSTTEALLSIVNDVLDVSKIEAGKLEINARPFLLQQALEKVSAIFSASLQLKRIAFRQQSDATLPAIVSGDAVRIQQILMNFLSNAYKFTPENGEIALQAKVLKPGWVRFSVRDSGIGISAKRVDQIFEAYEQETAETAIHYGGTGLGLSLCRSLAQLMGGRIGVDSEEGKGSCFWLEVPLPKADDRSLEQSAVELSLAGMNAWICEDDATSRKVLTRLLEKRGAQVQAFEHGQALLDQDYSAADFIILDCHMPVRDGYSTAEHLRESGYRQPVLALTAGVTAEEMQQCLDAGMDAVLSKPVQAQKLYQYLAEQLLK